MKKEMNNYKGLAVGSILLVLLSVLAVTPSASAGETVKICGFVYNDKNADGKRQPVTEEGLKGYTIGLHGIINSESTDTSVTGNLGQYCVTGTFVDTKGSFLVGVERFPRVRFEPGTVGLPGDGTVDINEPVIFVPTAPDCFILEEPKPKGVTCTPMPPTHVQIDIDLTKGGPTFGLIQEIDFGFRQVPVIVVTP